MAILSLVLGSSYGTSTPALAQEKKGAQLTKAVAQGNKPESKQTQAKNKEAEKAAKAQGQRKAQEMEKKIIEEAVQALALTRKVITALEKKDSDSAMAALERVIGKLEIILARNPKLALAPVDVVSYTLDMHADIASVKKAVKESIDLLKKGRVQDARAIVSNLASELVIEVINIPLATYPDAMKAAVPLIQDGKFKEAKQTLITALNTLVITRHIIPLPILRAEHLLKTAEKLAEKEGRSKDEQKQLEELLGTVRKELQFAEVLGYGDKEDFKAFYADIDEIQEKVAGGKHGKSSFDALEKALENYRKKLF